MAWPSRIADYEYFVIFKYVITIPLILRTLRHHFSYSSMNVKKWKTRCKKIANGSIFGQAGLCHLSKLPVAHFEMTDYPPFSPQRARENDNNHVKICWFWPNFSLRENFLTTFLVNGHTMLNTPVLVWSLKCNTRAAQNRSIKIFTKKMYKIRNISP